MRVIVKTVFGSKLYGTDTEKSDTDYKMIVVPSGYDILMGNGRKSVCESTSKGQNSNIDIDCETFTLHKFIEMLCVGETAAIEMVNTPKHLILESSPEWEYSRTQDRVL